jgi:gamma-glutamyltranspeptidase/glutathione hydrolase
MTAVNSSGPAAKGTPVDELRQEHGNSMPLVGPQTVTVPGLIAGWEALFNHGASLAWADLFSAAITQAEDGIPVGRSVATALAENEERLLGDPGMRRLFFPGGKPLGIGDHLRQPQLAQTLGQLAEHGAGSFYRGELGSTWLKTMSGLGSALETEDLGHFEPELSEPLRRASGGQDVFTAPPNSQGAIFLAILAALDESPTIDPLSSSAPSLARTFRAAAQNRDRYLADPRVSEVSLERLLDLGAGTGEPGTSVRAHGDTVALVTADSEGRAVSLIQSLFYSFGAGILDPETGIIAHNRGSCFSLDPSSPNYLAGGKRPAHTLTPAMVTEDGRLQVVLGTMGGLAQPQILTHVLQQLRGGADCLGAVSAPRWLVGAIDSDSQDQVIAEARVPSQALEALKADGWSPIRLGELDSETGEAQLITRDADGRYSAASDPRSEGLAETT